MKSSSLEDAINLIRRHMLNIDMDRRKILSETRATTFSPAS